MRRTPRAIGVGQEFSLLGHLLKRRKKRLNEYRTSGSHKTVALLQSSCKVFHSKKKFQEMHVREIPYFKEAPKELTETSVCGKKEEGASEGVKGKSAREEEASVVRNE